MNDKYTPFLELKKLLVPMEFDRRMGILGRLKWHKNARVRKFAEDFRIDQTEQEVIQAIIAAELHNS